MKNYDCGRNCRKYENTAERACQSPMDGMKERIFHTNSFKTTSWVVISKQNTNRQRVSQTADKLVGVSPHQKKKRWTGFPKQQNKKQVGGSRKEENEVDMVAQTAE